VEENAVILKGGFFTIKEETVFGNSRAYRIALNAAHPIFRAHFAGNPVMPGACIAQMIKELTAGAFGRDFFISTIKNMKFLRVINPVANPEISVTLTHTSQDDGNLSVSALISGEDVVFSKAIVVLKPVPLLQRRMQALGLCVVAPTCNNGKTLAGVLDDILRYTSSVIVVNDGSTDDTARILQCRFSGRVVTVSCSPNRGKGHALRKGFDKAEELDYKGAVTIDTDGQHFASEIETFVACAEKHPDTFLLGQRTVEGEMPAKNSFANKFSNFWFTVQTACRLNDTQNGFRLYPLAAMKGLRPVSSRYEAELEMLVRSVWKGLRILPVPVRVYYPPDAERVTHFRPGRDFLRISLLNTLLTLLAIVYGYPSMLLRRFYVPGKKKL
jgi:3-hydroxymyristoyl/3-hydroxydecanoyl-(acyl carrier protein) dehydratase